MEEELTSGLSPGQVARLLAIGVEGAPEDVERAGREAADALRDLLACKLPLDESTPDSLPALLGRPCEEMLASADRAMGDLLLDPDSEPSVIETLKDYGKQLVYRSRDKASRDAASAMYYAAIASALVFQRHKISKHSYEKLEKAFERLKRRSWLSSQLRDLFVGARALCRARASEARAAADGSRSTPRPSESGPEAEGV